MVLLGKIQHLVLWAPFPEHSTNQSLILWLRYMPRQRTNIDPQPMWCPQAASPSPGLCAPSGWRRTLSESPHPEDPCCSLNRSLSPDQCWNCVPGNSWAMSECPSISRVQLKMDTDYKLGLKGLRNLPNSLLWVVFPLRSHPSNIINAPRFPALITILMLHLPAFATWPGLNKSVSPK